MVLFENYVDDSSVMNTLITKVQNDAFYTKGFNVMHTKMMDIVVLASSEIESFSICTWKHTVWWSLRVVPLMPHYCIISGTCCLPLDN